MFFFSFIFGLTSFVFLDVLSPFPYCSISESGCLNFYLLSFLWYLDSVCQLLGSYGGHFLVVDPGMWALRNPQPESSELETWRLMYPSYANVVSGREHCPTTKFTFFFLCVAARLRGLWTIAPWPERHTRPVHNKLRTQDWKTLFKHLTHQFYF